MKALAILGALGMVLFAAIAVAVDIVNEGFEGGDIPSGWQVWQVGGDSTVYWIVDSWKPHSGTWHAEHGSHPSQDLDNWLVTETYDLSAYNVLTYSFWYAGYDSSNYTYTGFMLSTNASPTHTDFVEVEELGPPPEDYEQHSGDISAYAGNEYVTFAWQYTGLDGHGVLLDDILIVATDNAVQPTSLGWVKALMK
jgi:hypothetical protein